MRVANLIPSLSFSQEDVDTGAETIKPTDLRLNPTYIMWYINVTRLVVTGLVPFTLLTYLNSRIYTVIR